MCWFLCWNHAFKAAVGRNLAAKIGGRMEVAMLTIVSKVVLLSNMVPVSAVG